MSSFKEGGNSVASIEEAIDYVNNRLSVDESGMPAVRCTPADSVHGGLASQDQVTSCKSNPLVASHAPDPKLNASDQNEAQIPSELISHCVATLLMIQVNLRIRFLIFCVQDICGMILNPKLPKPKSWRSEVYLIIFSSFVQGCF